VEDIFDEVLLDNKAFGPVQNIGQLICAGGSEGDAVFVYFELAHTEDRLHKFLVGSFNLFLLPLRIPEELQLME